MKNISIITAITLLLVASFLFWKGEDVLEKASQSYTMFYFENTKLEVPKSNTENLKEALAFSIENNKPEVVAYEIIHLIDNQEIFSETIEIGEDEIEKIKPSEKLITEIEKKDVDSFIYQIKTERDNNEFKLTKKISLK